MGECQKIGGWVGVVACFLLLAQVGRAAKHQAYVMCRQKKIVRTIRVEVGIGGKSNCKTLYTKGGVDRVVGNGVHTQSCMRVANNIRGNLEAASWKCRDINSKVKISTSKVMVPEHRDDFDSEKEPTPD